MFGKKRRNIITFIMVIALVFLLAGCNGKTPVITGETLISIEEGNELPDLKTYIELTDAEMEEVTIDATAVDINTVGSYIVTYTIGTDDDAVTFELTVEVTAKEVVVVEPIPILHPVITKTSDIVYVIGEDYPDLFEGVTVVDEKFGDLRYQTNVDTSKVNYNEPGVYPIVYIAMNNDGYNTTFPSELTVTLNDALYTLPEEFFILDNGLVGVASNTGEIIIPLEYDSIEYGGDRMLRMSKNDSTYFYDLDAQEYHQYDYMIDDRFSEGFVTVANEFGLYAYMNKSGELITSFVFTTAFPFFDGLAAVRTEASDYNEYGTDNGNLGFIDMHGTIVIDRVHGSYSRHINGNIAIQILVGTTDYSDNYDYEIYSKTGEHIITLSDIDYTKTVVDEMDYYMVQINEKYALVDEDYNIFLDAEYDIIGTVFYKYNDYYAGTENYLQLVKNQDISIYSIIDEQVIETSLSSLLQYKNLVQVEKETGFGLYSVIDEAFVLTPEYTKIEEFNENTFIVTRADGLKAIVDYDGVFKSDFVIVNLAYEQDQAPAYRIFSGPNGLLGTIGSDGVVISPAKYLYINKEVNGFSTVTNGTTDKLGFIDETGSEIAEAVYFQVHDFVEGFAIVQVKESRAGWNYINEDGITVLDIGYDEITDFKDGYAKVRVGGSLGAYQWKYIDVSGDELTMDSYMVLGEMVDGYAVVKSSNTNYDTAGLINDNGDLIIPCNFNELWLPTDGMIRVRSSNGLIGFHNLNGTLAVPYFYASATDFNSGRAVVSNTSGWNHVIDKQGNTIIASTKDIIFEYYNGVARYRDDSTGFYGLLDRDGNEIIGPVYYSMGEFGSGRAVVSVGVLYGYIDTTGELVIPMTYKYAYAFRENIPFAIVKDRYEYGIIGIDGRFAIPAEYDNTAETEDGFFFYDEMDAVDLLYVDGGLTYQYMDNLGNTFTMVYDNGWNVYDGDTLVVDNGYDFIENESHHHEYWVVTRDGKDGLMDRDFTELVSPIYDYLSWSFDPFIRAIIDGNRGAMDFEGNELVPCIYDQVQSLYGTDYIRVELGPLYGLYNQDGEMILPVEYQWIEYIGADGALGLQ